MKRRNILGLATAAGFMLAATVNAAPPVTSGLVLWLDASDASTMTTNGTTVNEWRDKNGSAAKMTLLNGTPTLQASGIGGLPTVSFNTSSRMNDGVNHAAPVTIFYVSRQTGGTNARVLTSTSNNWLLGYWAGKRGSAWFNGDVILSGNGNSDTAPHLYAATIPGSGNNSTVWAEGVQLASNQGGTQGPNNLQLNGLSSGGGNEPSNCEISEVLVYNRILNSTELDAVGGYLAGKYGLTTSYPPVTPAAATGLTATPLFEGIRLDWTAAARATGYNVYRGTNTGTYDPTPIGTTTSPTTYSDMTVTSGGPYYYVVKATNSAGEGPASNEASASPSAVAVDQTVTFSSGSSVTKTAADAPFSDTASAFPSGSAVTYSVTPAAPTVATVDAATGVVTLMGSTGTVYVVASVEATPGYNAATNTQTLTVNQAIPVITWTSTPIVVGTYLSDTQLNATSGGVPGAFVYTPASGTLMDVVGPQNLSVQFTPTDTVKYSTPALKTVEFLVVPVETTVIWDTGAGTWNTTVANWKGQSSGLTTIFTQGNNAIFNSSAGGAITLASGMAPLTTTVSATSGTYTFSGGPLAGTGGGTLIKSGNGSLTLNNDNTYTGGTVINAGQLTMNTLVNGALGTGTVTLNGGILRLERITIGNALTVNGGILSCSNGWGCNWNGPITLNSNLTVSGDGNSGTTTFNGSVSGVGGFSFTGPAVLGPLLKVANTYTGPTSVKACTLRCDNKDSLGSGALSLSTTGKLNLNYTGTKTVESLTLGGVAKTAVGTYGSVASGADYRDDTYFVGTGTVRIAPPKGTVISFF